MGRRRRARAYFALLLALGLGVAGLAYRNAAALSDWYAAFAAYHLPRGASSFAPAETPSGAYVYCARQVARHVGRGLSIETFAGEEASRTDALGAGRYRVESFVDEVREDGGSERHAFACTARYQAGRWALEELTVAGRAGG